MDFDKLYQHIPKDPIKWTVNDVKDWLQFIDLGQYEKDFEQYSIDGSILASLTDEDLEKELNIQSKIKRKKIISWVESGFQFYSEYLQNKIQSLEKENKQITFDLYALKIKQRKVQKQKKIEYQQEYIKDLNKIDIINNGENSNISQFPKNTENQKQIKLGNHKKQKDEENDVEQGDNSDDSLDIKNIKKNLKKNKQYNRADTKKEQNKKQNNLSDINQQDQNQEQLKKEENKEQEEEKQCEKEEQNGQNLQIKDQQLLQNIDNQNIIEEKELIIEPYEQVQQINFYCISKEGSKIGRHSKNQILLLDDSISRFHAEIVYKDGEFYLKDSGSTTGTFIQIEEKLILQVGMQIELGSCQFNIDSIQNNIMKMHVMEGQFENLSFELDFNSQPFYQIGRKKANQISIEEDQHLSHLHSKISLHANKIIIEDMGSTNGTWRRLSREGEVSEEFLLRDKTKFKIGIANTYICKYKSRFIHDNSQIEHNYKCVICWEKEKDALFSPCRHNTSCLQCAKNLKKCPLCRENIDELIKIYK